MGIYVGISMLPGEGCTLGLVDGIGVGTSEGANVLATMLAVGANVVLRF